MFVYKNTVENFNDQHAASTQIMSKKKRGAHRFASVHTGVNIESFNNETVVVHVCCVTVPAHLCIWVLLFRVSFNSVVVLANVGRHL